MYYLFVILWMNVIFENILHSESHVLSKRVVGGEPISIAKAPWMAMITTSDGQQFCGGSIISNTTILTAAQCLYDFYEDEIFVVISVTGINETKPENLHSVKKWILHPDFSSRNRQSDIAVLFLNESIDISKYPPIKLPPAEEQNYNNACTAGWGSVSANRLPSNDLREVCFTSKDFKNCSKNWPNTANSKTHLCIGENERNSCFGDAGGPLYTNVKRETMQIGVVSYNVLCGKVDTLFTRVSHFVQWIEKKMNSA